MTSVKPNLISVRAICKGWVKTYSHMGRVACLLSPYNDPNMGQDLNIPKNLAPIETGAMLLPSAFFNCPFSVLRDPLEKVCVRWEHESKVPYDCKNCSIHTSSLYKLCVCGNVTGKFSDKTRQYENPMYLTTRKPGCNLSLKWNTVLNIIIH